MTISRLLMTPSFVSAAGVSVLLLPLEISLAQPMRFDKNLIGDVKTEAQPQTVAHRNFRGGGGFHGGGFHGEAFTVAAFTAVVDAGLAGAVTGQVSQPGL